MTHSEENPLQHPQVQLATGSHILIGYVVSVILMGLSLATVMQQGVPSVDVAVIITVIAALALLIQGYFWLRLDFSQTQRWTTVSLLLFIPLFMVTVGLTAWMFHTLYARTMLPGIMH